MRVEPLWVALQPKENGWEKVINCIALAFKTHSKVMIESLGASEEFQSFLKSLKNFYQVKMIRVCADLELCYSRVKNRNKAEHIPVSDEKLWEYNKIASQVEFDWFFEIDNNGTTPAELIIKTFSSL